jgi:hypothetical protein
MEHLYHGIIKTMDCLQHMVQAMRNAYDLSDFFNFENDKDEDAEPKAI